jgi:membrane-associated protease RseP (regulator of RpoE activity)
VNVALFVATVLSMFVSQIAFRDPDATMHAAFVDGLEFTASLAAILLAHEFGHYVAARLHKVEASLPFFLPMPFVSPFGTMGAVIHMRSTIPTRRALLDIGAAGPLAGLLVSIPLYAWGVAHAHVAPIDTSGGGAVLGDSLLTKLLDHFFAVRPPEGYELHSSGVAFAGWAGLFVTMVNLIPAGQLDAGHVAYSLLGPRQNRVAPWVHRSMLAFFFVCLGSFVARDVRSGFGLFNLGRHVNSSLFWFVWFEVLAILGGLPRSDASRDREHEGNPLDTRVRLFGTGGLALLAYLCQDRGSPAFWAAWFLGLGVLIAMEVRWGVLRSPNHAVDHPPTGDEPLDGARRVVAVVTLALFALLFMPAPIALG